MSSGFDTGFEPFGLNAPLYFNGFDPTGATSSFQQLSTYMNNYAAAGGGMLILPPATVCAFDQTLVVPSDVIISGMPGSKFKWTGANATAMFSQSTAAGPTQRWGINGFNGAKPQIDPGTANGVVMFDLHSAQFTHLRDLDLLANNDQTGTIIRVRCDVTSNGGYGSNRNSIYSDWGHLTVGKHGTFLDMAGVAVTSQVVTLNGIHDIHGLNTGVQFVNLGDFVDNNVLYSVIRTSLNQNNVNGWNTGTTQTNNYAQIVQVFQPDTFAGKTGRAAVVLNSGGGNDRTQFGYLFNNPAAENAPSLLSPSWMIAGGDFGQANLAANAIGSSSRRQTLATSFQTLTYSASMTPDLTLVSEQGFFQVSATDNVAFAFANPAGTSQGVVFTLIVTAPGTSGVGAITFPGGNYLLTGGVAFVGPSAANKTRQITFLWNPILGKALELSRTTADT